MKLRKYQRKNGVEYVESKIWSGGQFRLCLESPTGSGKSVILAELLLGPYRQIVFTHRKILLKQLSAVLTKHGVRHGFRASGRKPDPEAHIQLAMIQSEVSLAKKYRAMLTAAAECNEPVGPGIERVRPFNADLVHIDEMHVQRGGTYQTIFNDYYAAGASIVGYTATPSDLGGMVDECHRVVGVPELIRQGFLCPPRVFGCGQPDAKLLEKLRRDSRGEYLPGELDKIVKPEVIFGNVVHHYKRLNPDGRPFVLFAHSVKASLWWAQMLTNKGIPTAHIDAKDIWVNGQLLKSDDQSRQKIFDMLANGELAGVSNRFVLREGWDCPAIGHAILTCPFGRRTSYVQACGRVLRPYPNREYAIVQDHSGSSLNHPELDSGEAWDWELPAGVPEKIRISRMREDEIPEPIICPQCMGQRAIGDTCPYCGFRYPKHAHYVIQSDGSLKLVQGRMFKPRHVRRKEGDEKTWKRLYWSTVKNSARTAEQAYVYYAYKNNWRWLPRDLPLMPRDQADWFVPLRNVPPERLIRAA